MNSEPVSRQDAERERERAEQFEREHARSLRALAYRMLGSRAEAEDMVQEAWLRWAEVDATQVQHAGAYLSRLTTNLCLDKLRSAAQQREHYVGTWLPEPLVDEAMDWSPSPEVGAEFAQDVSVAFMLALERLSPLERAAFLLHDVFDLNFEEVGERLQRSAAACRQLASRARNHVRADHARVEVKHEEGERLRQSFVSALLSGNVEGLAQLLSEEALLLTDGGGRATAVPYPLHGGLRIARALVGFARGFDPSLMSFRPAQVNGLPGYVIELNDGSVLQTVALDIGPDLKCSAIYIVRNPDKLTHLRRKR
ncbi:RNA polymerase sigma factor SigJ [Paucibacter sp. AS339]|uniref:RNA polymerase sigma factor SigJ n=1 Tax=Paucibacter hankyongi TaxID=3133434 RepID=UPI00309D600F